MKSVICIFLLDFNFVSSSYDLVMIKQETIIRINDIQDL